MVKALNKQVQPSLQDLLELLGLAPMSELGKLLQKDKHNKRPWLSSTAPSRPTAPCKSLSEAARILGYSYPKMQRLLKTYEADGVAGVE